MQGLGNTADLGRNGFDGCPQGGYSPRCSSTMRTARSRTSGENLFDFFMAPFSQMLEPPQNPGRFNEVIREIFSAIKVGAVSPSLIERAQLRSDVGNPPGKKDSLGDAINWEWLLEQEIEFWDDELIIISADGDYESNCPKGSLKSIAEGMER